MKMPRWSVLLMGSALLFTAQLSHAQFAVIDVAAVAKMIEQVKTMSDQLATARNQLTQAQRTLEAMRGGRGMERLLEGTVRNYLPPSWTELERAVDSASGQYRQLSVQFQQLVQASAVLSPQVLAGLSASDRAALEEARRAAAMMQVSTRAALTASSDRFASLQQLVNAIPSAADQKGILDLQARIAVEQGMLANEQTKLYVLTQAAQADEQARRQKLKEEALNAIGSLRSLPPIGL
jgi:type IV secretion system protein VirB5